MSYHVIPVSYMYTHMSQPITISHVRIFVYTIIYQYIARYLIANKNAQYTWCFIYITYIYIYYIHTYIYIYVYIYTYYITYINIHIHILHTYIYIYHHVPDYKYPTFSPAVSALFRKRAPAPDWPPRWRNLSDGGWGCPAASSLKRLISAIDTVKDMKFHFIYV